MNCFFPIAEALGGRVKNTDKRCRHEYIKHHRVPVTMAPGLPDDTDNDGDNEMDIDNLLNHFIVRKGRAVRGRGRGGRGAQGRKAANVQQQIHEPSDRGQMGRQGRGRARGQGRRGRRGGS
jgi:hypothetical protein